MSSVISLIIVAHFLRWNTSVYGSYIFLLGIITPISELSKFSSSKLILSELLISDASKIASIALMNQLLLTLILCFVYVLYQDQSILAVGFFKISQAIKDIFGFYGYRLLGKKYDLKTMKLSVVQLGIVTAASLLSQNTYLVVSTITLTYLTYSFYEFFLFRISRFLHIPSKLSYLSYANYGFNNFINSVNNNTYRVVLKTYRPDVIIFVEVFTNIYKVLELLISSMLQTLSAKLRVLSRSTWRSVMNFLNRIYMLTASIYLIVGVVSYILYPEYRVLICLMVLGRFFSTNLSPMKSILQTKKKIKEQRNTYLIVTLFIGILLLSFLTTKNGRLLELLLLIPALTMFCSTKYNLYKSFSVVAK